MKRWFDHKKSASRNLEVGDLVLKWDKEHEDRGKHTKFQCLWLGSFIIVEKLGPSTFRLQTLEGDIENLPVNGHLIKKYFCWSPLRDYPVYTLCGFLGLWNFFSVFILLVCFEYFLISIFFSIHLTSKLITFHQILWLIYKSCTMVLLSWMLPCCLTSWTVNGFFVFLDITKFFLSHVNIN